MADRPLTVRYKEALENLGTREPSTEFEADAILDGIRVEKGYLDEETLVDVQAMRNSSRQTILRLVEKGKETEAAYTKSISEQLYSSKYHFLYELIQNADDSNYSNAKTSLSVPYMHFKVTTTTLVVETNEDGFTRANIEAICATGKSSKKATALDNHIGEKGFGFKSVFSIADEVHVQSGLWKFRFKHQRGDDGLGMVTPLNSSYEILPSDIVTRITLVLSDISTQGHQRLSEAIAQIPETTILHLHNLRRLKVTRMSDNTTSITSTTKSSSRTANGNENVRILVRTWTDGQWESINSKNYYTFARKIKFMPQDDRRRNCTSAKVDLAFPVDAMTQKPKMNESGQHVFAYLPLYQLPIQVSFTSFNKLQFIIQSDFITSASRESLIDCAWNEALLIGVVETFCNAVATFANKTHPLRHLWLQYLPKDIIHNSFWQQMYPLIKSKLQHMPVLQTWQGGIFKTPLMLRRLRKDFMYRDKPLFRDTSNEIYLAQEYDHGTAGLPASLGVPIMSHSEEISRMEADLVRLDSHLKSPDTLNAWHRACARKILSILNQETTTSPIRHRIKRLAIIPINDGRSWTGAPGISPGGLNAIYFPTINGIAIPSSLGFHLVSRASVSDPERTELFRKFGVVDCTKNAVVEKIMLKHISVCGDKEYKGTVENILEELQCLFHLYPEPKALKGMIVIPLSTMKIFPADVASPLYFLSADENDTQNLLPPSFIYVDQPNRVANFMSDKLSDLEVFQANSEGYLWRDWLRIAAAASYHPPLCKTRSDTRELSDTLLAVLHHSPHKFIGMLKAHWTEYRTEIHQVLEDLKSLEVPCTFGKSESLFKCYLPTTDVMSKVRSLRAEDCIPVVELPQSWSEDTSHEWDFLGKIGVASSANLMFYITIHDYIIERLDDGSPNLADTDQILTTLFTALAGLVTANDYEDLRYHFDYAIGYVSDGDLHFRDLDHCVWDGPSFLTLKTPLKQYYGHLPLLENFFKIALNIADYNIDDIIEELEWEDTRLLTRDGWEKIYRFLDENIRSPAEWDRLRDVFKKNELICGANEQLYALQNCLWRSPFPLSGYIELSQIYPDLESFFVKRLGVQKADPSMLIKEVSKMAKEHPPQIDTIQQRLVGIGTLTSQSGIGDNVSNALKDLANIKFLPKVKADGSKILVGKDDDFTINDHQRFGDAFKSQFVLLDFSIEEVHILNTLFGYLGLSDKYLSHVVAEVSTVSEDAGEDQGLTRAFRYKAHALYCCAAQYKSTQALRGDVALFERLSTAQILITDSISTDLVLEFDSDPVKVHSSRLAVHHELHEERLKIYVPKDGKQRKSCYRSQLPQLLVSLLGVTPNASHAIFQILSCHLQDLDDILSEQDIATVDWIEKPVYSHPASSESDPDSAHEPTTTSPGESSEGNLERNTTASPPSNTSTLLNASIVSSHADTPSPPATPTPIGPRPPRYDVIVEEVVQSAYRARNPHHRSPSSRVSPIPVNARSSFNYDHEETFGNRRADEIAHDRRIGALGEAYVFEIFSSLDLPDFGRENWRSNMRRELLHHPRYADLGDWQGRETSDFVYTDRDGKLTQYLRDHCIGSMPEGIAQNRDFTQHPLEYFLEVKSTTSICNTRFYMSGSQYRRMQNCAVPVFGDFNKVYVILRVFNLGQDTDMKIFVDPFRSRLHDQYIEFEIGTYHCKTKDVA